MTWNEGYVAEINYTYGFYGELSPAKLSLAALLKSVQSPKPNQSFTYCELACGQGYSTNLLAATYPQSQFYATDFNPSQIAGAKALAEAAGNRNVHFFEDSFQEFLERDLPEFDFICLHGIYSWITPANRQAIVNFIRRQLKVGGLVYISYNALPGWAAAMPLRELIFRQGERSSEPIIPRIDQALDFAGKLLESNAGYFTQNPALKSRLEKLKEQDRHYLAHEYFCQDWHPFYFDQVVKELEVAKLNYVGSAHLLDHVDAVNLSSAAKEQLAQISDPIYREVVRDYFLNTQFRRDIFGRGILNLTAQERLQQLLQTHFALIVPLTSVQFEQQFPIGQATLQKNIYRPLCNVLASKNLTLSQLQTHEETKQIPLNNLFQALLVLIGLGYVHPAVDDKTCKQRQKSTDAFNAAVQARAIYSSDLNYLASPRLGTGVAVNRFEQLFLTAKARNQDLAQFVWQVLSSQGQQVVQEGKALATPAENLAYLKQKAEEFCSERLLLLQKLGIS